MSGFLLPSGLLLLFSSHIAMIYALRQIEPKYPEWNERQTEPSSKKSTLMQTLAGGLLAAISQWKSGLAPWIFLAAFTSIFVSSHIRFRRLQPPDTVLFVDLLYTASSLLAIVLLFLSMQQ